VALQGLNLAELSPTEPWRRWDLVLANLDFQRAVEQWRNAVASQLGNSTIEGGRGCSDASPTKAWGGAAPRSSGGPPRPGGGVRAASWKLSECDNS
jgi:hypothetical protein